MGRARSEIPDETVRNLDPVFQKANVIPGFHFDVRKPDIQTGTVTPVPATSTTPRPLEEVAEFHPE